jgi:hypothetical protein
MDDFLRRSVLIRLITVRSALVRRSAGWVEEALSRGVWAFEVAPTIHLEEAVRKAIGEFRLEVNAFPPYLRKVLTPEIWDWQIKDVEDRLSGRIPYLVMRRRGELEKEFKETCRAAYWALVKEARDDITLSTEWTADLEAEWLARFSDAVRYNVLPPAMKEAVQETYALWCELTANRLRDDRETPRMPLNWERAERRLFTIAVLAIWLALLIKQCRVAVLSNEN